MNIIIGLLLIGAGIASIVYLRPKMQNHLTEIQYLETSTAAELEQMFQQMDDSGLGADYRHYVELKGAAQVDHPVQTPYSNQQVAYCDSQLLQVTEERERYRDSNGNWRQRTSKREEVISSEKSSEPLFLNDNSSAGTIQLEVNGLGCKLDIPTTLNRFEPKNNLNQNIFGSFSFRDTPSTLGFKMKERVIRCNQQLYVIGEAFRHGDQIVIGKPMDNKRPFIISTKSEDDLVNNSKRNVTLALVGGIAGIVIGIVILLFFR